LPERRIFKGSAVHRNDSAGRVRASVFASWLTDTERSLILPFAKGIKTGFAAVETAPTEPWSNGQTEGQITKLKLVKRQRYGRAKFDPLRVRLIVTE
jgi:transposase